MRFTIARKITLLLVLPFLAALLLLGSIPLLYLSRVEADAMFINLAGRQRMLSEQMGRYVRLAREEAQGAREDLLALIGRFDRVLEVLREGGQLPGTASPIVPPPEDVADALDGLAGHWSRLKPVLELVAGLAPGTPRASLAWATAEDRIPSLTGAAEEVVNAFIESLRRRQREMVLLLALNAVLTLLLCLGGSWAARRYLVEPVLRLRDAAEAIQAGNYRRRVAVRTSDEFADLAAAFNAMASKISTALRTERERRARQASLTEAIIALAGEVAAEPLLRRVGELAREATGARYAMLAHEAAGERHFVSIGESREELASILTHPPGEQGLLDLVWTRHEPIRGGSGELPPGLARLPEGHIAIRSFLGAPIEFEGVVRGALFVGDKNGGEPFTDEDERVIKTVAAACAVALANAASHEALVAANRELDARVAERTRELEKANTLLRSREVELELINEELVRSSEAKSEFLANTSHELRTPLNAIIGFSDLLLASGDLSERQALHARYINEGGRNLLSIINNLLDLSKIEAGAMEIQEEVCTCGSLLDHVSSTLLPLAEKKGIEFVVSRPDRDVSVVVDSGKLRQVFTNLVGNAIKFTGAGGRVEIGLEIAAGSDGPALVGFVRDNGIGIAQEDRERIFEPFVQAKTGLSRSHGGTGLGLPLTRRLVHILGGTLDLESEPGEGSCFTFRVPVRPTTEEPPLEMAAPGESRAAAEPITDERISVPVEAVRPRILVVDEDEARAATVVRMLEAEGYEGVVVELQHVDAEAQQVNPFVILLGIPEDPVEIYERLHLLRSRRGTRHVPLLLLGGDAERPRFSFGTIDHVAKELSRNELMDMISHYGRHLPTRTHAAVVLVVDDEASTREYLRATLMREGYRVLQAADGEQGLRLAIEREPDLIILDLMMPGLSGFDVVERLKRHPTACDIPVVIFTAREPSREEVMRLGQEVEKVLIKGVAGLPEIVRELRALELLYPLQARLVDSVLQVYNSRYMDLRLSQECSRAVRYGQSFSVVAWQVDGFDDYVAAHGLRWAIAALKEMLETVASVTRKGDVVMRMRESRFALLLPGVAPENAERAAEKLRLRFRHQRFPLPGSDVGRLTASFGLVSYGPDGRDREALTMRLNARVDRAIAAGGDRCVRGEE